MCFPKNKKGRPIPPPSKASSLRTTSTQSKANLSKKKVASAPAKVPTTVPPATEPESHGEPEVKEKTCISEKSDLMQISLYKTKKKEKEKEKEKEGSGSGPIVTKPADRDQDSPEVFENNAQAVSLNPVNVTQIFVDSVIPQTNVSKQHTDIIDQNTLENVDPNMEDMIFDRLDSGEEHYPEAPQPRPKANVLEPEDDTVADTISERRSHRQSEKRTTKTKMSAARTEHRPATTPDRLPTVYTPPPVTKSEKVFRTGRRIPRGQVSTRTATTSRPRTQNDYRSAGRVQHDDALDNTCPSHEPLDRVTQRTLRPSTTEYRTVTAMTAVPIEAKDNTCGSREPLDSPVTARKAPSCMQSSNIYTAHMIPKDP